MIKYESDLWSIDVTVVRRSTTICLSPAFLCSSELAQFQFIFDQEDSESAHRVSSLNSLLFKLIYFIGL